MEVGLNVAASDAGVDRYCWTSTELSQLEHLMLTGTDVSEEDLAGRGPASLNAVEVQRTASAELSNQRFRLNLIS